MKRQNNFKKLVLGLTVVSTVVFMSSCDNQRRDDDNTRGINDNIFNDQTEDSKEKAEEQNEAVLRDRQDQKDADFLVEAAAISLEEIHLAQLAQIKSTDTEVKRIGKMMEKDYTKSLNEVKELASKKGISIPTTLTEDGKEAYDELNEKRESDFNEDYCDRMVKDHKRAIDKFEKASRNAEDDEIKSWAISTLPKLRENLNQADICQSKDKDEKKAATVLK